MDEYLTIDQVAEYLKLSKQTVWKRCKEGSLPAFKLPPSRKWYIARKDLEKFVKEQKLVYAN
jgi:excisionase family DNA binding protein